MGALERWLRDVVPPIALILAIDLVVTVLFLGVSGTGARIGTLRPVNTIPSKVLELLLVGGGVGLVASLAAKKLDVSLVTLAVGFVALLDFDHLPSVFGVEQPIRPTHSFTFLAIEVVALAFAFRARPGLVPLAVSAFFAHLAGDTGIFAPYTPFLFTYTAIGAYRIPFALLAIMFALIAGWVSARHISAAEATDHTVRVQPETLRAVGGHRGAETPPSGSGFEIHMHEPRIRCR